MRLDATSNFKILSGILRISELYKIKINLEKKIYLSEIGIDFVEYSSQKY